MRLGCDVVVPADGRDEFEIWDSTRRIYCAVVVICQNLVKVMEVHPKTKDCYVDGVEEREMKVYRYLYRRICGSNSKITLYQL